MASDLNPEEVLALGQLHAELETRRELDPLMKTLVPEPVYEFYPARLRLTGGERTRRYYEQFFANFMERIVGYTLLEEWTNASSVAQEYDITVNFDGEPETLRVLGVLFVEGKQLGGERIYCSERAVHLMTGTLFDELESF